MELILTTCILRDWKEGDEESLVYYANNKKIWDNVRDIFPHPYTMEHATWWVKEGWQKPGTLSLAIEVDGKAVGGIGFLFKEDIYRRSVEIGYWLGEEYWGRGITTEAVNAMKEYAFANFDVCRVYACVFEWNHASMRVLDKAGFECEARLKKEITKNGVDIDEYIYSVVR